MPQKKRGQTPVEEAVARILNALDVPEKTEEIPLLQALGLKQFVSRLELGHTLLALFAN